MVQHGAGAQHDVPAVAVLIHGTQHEHHREKGHGQAAGGNVLEGVQPARQFPAGKDAHQLAHRHHGADAGRKDVGILGVKMNICSLPQSQLMGRAMGSAQTMNRFSAMESRRRTVSANFSWKAFPSCNISSKI